MKKLLILLTLIFCGSALRAQDPVLKTLKEEANRNLEVLKKRPIPAYYISYSISDLETINITSSFGSTIVGDPTHSRTLQTQIRVGNYDFDDSHELKNSMRSFNMGSRLPISIEDNNQSLKDFIWQSTIQQYKSASQKLENVKSNSAVFTSAEDKSPDFSKQQVDNNYQKPIQLNELKINLNKWKETLGNLSGLMNANKDIVDGRVIFSCEVQRRLFYNTEGSSNTESSVSYRLMVSMNATAGDGMDLPLYKSYFASKLENLPTKTEIEKDIKSLSLLLSDLKKAPLAEPYSGPCIVSAEASGVFFHEFFGHRIEGSKMKQTSDAQTFKSKIGEKVLSEKISVTFDPTLKMFNGQALNGSYIMDDEGVRGQRVEVVKNGILKNFLMSRKPLEGFLESNGHGRAALGYDPTSRQSNMFIQSTHPLTKDSLLTKLKAELKVSGKEYGYLFSSVSGGFTYTSREAPNAFNVTPLVVYRIYADNRPQELVRGVNIIGTPLSVFSQILECGDDYEIFNGICGSDSGNIPVSCVAPALLVRQIETQKKPQQNITPQILERP